MIFTYNEPGFDEQFGNIVFSSITNVIIIVLVYYLLALIFAIWTYKNSKIRGMKYKSWFIGVLLTGIIGLLVYLTIRDPIRSE